MKKVAYVDAPAGIAGDMCLGAWIDLGWPLSRLEAVVKVLELEGVGVTAARVQRKSLAATKVDVAVQGPEVVRHLPDVVQVLERARALAPEAVEDAVLVFRALAEAEGKVHGHPPEKVHFHEVGAEDALVDILGTCVARRDLGIDEVRVGPLPMGRGTVETQHGRLPLPAPATLHLLEGLEVVPSKARYEQVTPTGAALMRALATPGGVPAGFRIETIGVGAGSHEGDALPNVVRIVVGEVATDRLEDTAVLLESNLDDATGQELGRVLERALEAGALDAWLTPMLMKKGRPGHVVSLLAAERDAEQLTDLLFVETPTLGVRRRTVSRRVLVRRHEAVSTPWGEIRMKVRETPRGPAATPEYEDCRRRANEHGVPLREVIEAARRAWSS